MNNIKKRNVQKINKTVKKGGQKGSAQEGGDQAQLQVKVDDELLPGRYSNLMQIVHTKEEFVFDYFLNTPPQGILVGRIILNPAHAKRMLSALKENLDKYEQKYGEISLNPGTPAV
jgi:hypothetical protein